MAALKQLQQPASNVAPATPAGETKHPTFGGKTPQSKAKSSVVKKLKGSIRANRLHSASSSQFSIKASQKTGPKNSKEQKSKNFVEGFQFAKKVNTQPGKVSNSQSVKKKVRPKRTKEEEPLKNVQRVLAIPKKKILKKERVVLTLMEDSSGSELPAVDAPKRKKKRKRSSPTKSASCSERSSKRRRRKRSGIDEFSRHENDLVRGHAINVHELMLGLIDEYVDHRSLRKPIPPMP